MPNLTKTLAALAHQPYVRRAMASMRQLLWATILIAGHSLCAQQAGSRLLHQSTSSTTIKEQGGGRCSLLIVENDRFVDLNRRILEEHSTVQRCYKPESEGVYGHIDVTMWPLDSGTKPLFRFKTLGVHGAVNLPWYVATEQGCCGPGDLDHYFSLQTGKELFASSGAILRLLIAEIGGPYTKQRVIAIHDSYSASLADEEDKDSTVIAVLQFGDGETPSQRWLLRAPGLRDYNVGDMSVRRGARPIDDQGVRFESGARVYPKRSLGNLDSLVLVVSLRNSFGDKELLAQIPITMAGPQPAGAVLTPPLQLVRPRP